MFINSSLCLFVNGLSFHETVISAGYFDTKMSHQTENGHLSAQLSTVDAAFSSSPSLLCAANVIFSVGVGGNQYKSVFFFFLVKGIYFSKSLDSVYKHKKDEV